ncbi:D-alanyl-D-alanine carboxypeptidase family protein [Rhodococcus sp. IEGM 1379]|uniref:D-alanyl-D-alanine carboxypeptidase family protein n=1 Tax=Rhodococcus sp. IEGM 1379 TaxID=3047086 RepID=UPI0024B6DC9E|nr:D-alanyl-D-alanine carboxypeptidase family protein [Rhodococcus sp. IEGM 1379]MDI9914747.1 D-alanyl-D-alanine carboxypeptidase family protein [Rhodococcus sp. IEGM 1379]
MMWRRACAVVVAGTVLSGIGGVSGIAGAQPAPPPAPTTSAPFTTPNTDSCPFTSRPAPAVDLSEVPSPGTTAPAPMPVPSDPVGGDQLGGCGVILPAGAPPLPADIAASGWVLADANTGEVLAAKDPHGRYRPASTIKMLLALVALDELNLDTVVTATAEDANAEGSAVGIGKDGTYTNRQLMQGLVMASGNDAAHALARQLGGDAAAVKKMNALAADLGALDTRTATPSGLDGPGMSSSPYDLAVIFHAALQNPTFAELIHTETVEFPGFPKDPTIPEDQDRPGFTLANDNQLLYNYDGALGGKTGFTDDARHTYVGAAQRNGRTLLVTLMGGEAKPIRPWEQAARLLDFGFSLTPTMTVGTLTDLTSTYDKSDVATMTERVPPGEMSTAGATPGSHFSTTARTAIIGSGAAVVLGLILGSVVLSRRRR